MCEQGVSAEHALNNLQRIAGAALDPLFRRQPSMSMIYASADVRAPLVMTLSGVPKTPDILEMVSEDGSKQEYAIVDRARFERLRAVARAVWTKQVGGPEWTGTYEDDIAISRALNQMLDSDVDPLP